jgi:hypothetical protein
MQVAVNRFFKMEWLIHSCDRPYSFVKSGCFHSTQKNKKYRKHYQKTESGKIE